MDKMADVETEPEALKFCLRTWLIADKIFQNLSLKELWNLKAVSAEFNKSVENFLPYLQDFDTSDLQFVNSEEMQEQYGKKSLLNSLCLFKNLKRVTVVLGDDDTNVADDDEERARFQNRVFNQFVQLLKRNKNITVMDINLTCSLLAVQHGENDFNILERLLLGHPKLQKLTLDASYHVDDDSFEGEDDECEILMNTYTRKYEHLLKTLTTASPYLKHLEIAVDVYGLTVRYDDACLLASASPLMQRIYLGRFMKVTKKGIMSFIDASPNLRGFDFSGADRSVFHGDSVDFDGFNSYDVGEILMYLADKCHKVAVLNLISSCSCEAIKHAISKLPGLQSITCHLGSAEEIAGVFEVMTESLEDVKHLRIEAAFDGDTNIRGALMPFFQKFTNLQSFRLSGHRK